MTARCKSRSLTEAQRIELGHTPNLHSVYDLEPGREYTILAVLFVARFSIYGSTALFEIRDDFGRCFSVPACLFDIVDPRPSMNWRGKQLDNGSLALWPEEFYEDFFHDQLSDGVPSKVEAFERLVQRMTSEFVSEDKQQ